MSVLRMFIIILTVAIASSACGSPAPRGPQPIVAASGTPPARSAYFNDPVPIGVKFDQPAFSEEANGVFAGFDIDLATYLATHLGYNTNSFEEVNDTNRATALGKTVKLVIATYSITGARELGWNGQPKVDFAGPYMITPDALLVKRGSKYAAADPNLDNVTVCSLPGSTTEPGAVQLPKSTIQITAADYSQCVQDVENGTADAVLTDALILYGYANDSQQYPGLVVEATQYGSMNQYGIGLPHGQVAGCEELIPVVESFITDGSWAKYFQIEFPGVVSSDPSWQQDYRPDVNSVPADSYCQ